MPMCLPIALCLVSVRVVHTDPLVHVEAFARHLGAVRGQSEHTQRAYLGDLRNLMAFVRDRGINDLSDVTLSDLGSLSLIHI